VGLGAVQDNLYLLLKHSTHKENIRGGGEKTVRVVFEYLSRARICKRLRSPVIDSEDSIPPAYVDWWVSTTTRVIVPERQAT
jgi:hypothetical protein